jgi:tetratricopeptide (TPR) repeat protein
MNRKMFYLTTVAVLIVAVAGIIYNYSKKQKEKEELVYQLLPRKGAAAQSAEWKSVQTKALELTDALKTDPSNNDAQIRLAALYIQEARETGNRMYYDKAAMSCVNKILKTDSLNFNALVYKSLIYLSQHHFSDGLAAAQKAQTINPANAYVYGLLVDAYVELGKYDSAIINADRMVSIRPDLTSYSRISYLREIFGNYKSAIEAMKMAVESGGRGDEHTEWTRVQLASLYEKTGDYNNAEMLYDMSLALRPDYPYALAGQARLATSRNDFKNAIGLYEKADSLISDNSIREELADVYRMAGDNKKAEAISRVVIEDLTKDAKAGDNDEAIGHYADRELAYAFLKVKDVDKALEHALLEYNRRPENIDVNETVAWVYYSRGEYAKALPYIKTALKTNSKNPVLLSRAGLIYFKSGDKQLAKALFSESNMANAFIGHSLQTEASTIIQSL